VSVDLFQLILILAVAGGAVAALLSFAGSARLYDRIGRGYLHVPDDSPNPSFESWNAEAALDTRQLLDARAALRRRHGKGELDDDTEIRSILRELDG
jgi:hypothetical protein